MVRIVAFALSIAILFCSCNADILSSDVPTYTGETSSSDTRVLFSGQAPKNIYASKSYYQDRIVVSFDSVTGADYYEVYTAKVARDTRDYDVTSLQWMRNDSNIEDTGKAQILFSFYPEEEEKDDYYYLFSVRAASYYNGGRNINTGDASSVAEGWTLSPPANVSASQGLFSDRINLSWEQLDNIRGYNIYKFNSANGSYERVNNTLIPSSFTDVIEYGFIPSEDELGSDLYFRVSALSLGGDESEYSGIRNGYTFVFGAPQLPKDLVADQAASPTYINVSWEKPSNDVPTAEGNNPYVWEIYRSTPSSDSTLIASFTAFNDESTAPSVTLEDGRYVYKDTSGLVPNTVYTYTVRATVIDGAGENATTLIGPAEVASGFIMAAPSAVSLDVNYPKGDDAGSFDIEIASPPPGFSADKNWSYNLYGRSNTGLSTGEWNLVDTGSVVEEGYVFPVSYADYPYNEFSVTLTNGVEETAIALSTVLVADQITLDDISISSNRYDSALSANENGVYPVWLDVRNSERFKSIDLTVTMNGEDVSFTLPVSSSVVAIPWEYTPAKPFESYSYSVKGNSYFGRATSTSPKTVAYGALTGEKFIKLFESFAMKPWEFVSHPDFPENLKTKWINNDMHKAIDAHGMDSLGNYTVPSEYHGGSINYVSTANIMSMTGTVVFTFTNFGEIEEMYSNGSYTMSGVNMSGNNGSVSGNVIVSGMYPASVDFGKLSVTSYAFSGKYGLTQDNGSGTVEVTATRNE